MAFPSINLARSGLLAGLNLAGLVRLSFETDDDDVPGSLPLTGRDIRGRDEQTRDCRAYVEQRGGTYIHTYEEPNTSAYKRRPVRLQDGRTVYRVVRPVFEAALADLKKGKAPTGQRLDGLVVYDIDRLTRDPRNLEDAIEVVEHFGKPIIDITGSLDLLTDNGRTMARIIVAAANKSSADTGRRVRRKHEAMQRQGIPAGGALPFGWKADRRTLDPIEADLFRSAVARFLAGAPLTAIAADWNRRGIPTRKARQWMASNFKVMFRNPRSAGYRGRLVYDTDPQTGRTLRRMEVVLDPDGDPVIGQWEPIISVDEWRAVLAVLDDNRSRRPVGDNARKYLLSGVLRCGNDGCGAKMRGSARVVKGVEIHYYQCPSNGLGGCGGVAITGPKADEFITEAVIAKFELESERRNASDLPDQWPGEADLAEVRQRITELTAGWRARPQQISTARYFALLPELERDEHALMFERDRWLAERAALAHRPLSIRDDWYAGRLNLAERRAYVERFLAAIMVAPVDGARGRWNPDRMTLVWRTANDGLHRP
jgi:site-specific DNA recombinase